MPSATPIAENAGYVLIKVRLDWETMWRDWPQTNPEMRQFLTQNPGEQALFVLDLDDGSVPYIANVGHGGYGDGGYMPMGPQPVVRRLPNGKEVVYSAVATSQDDGGCAFSASYYCASGLYNTRPYDFGFYIY